jgi:hypothetical protein
MEDTLYQGLVVKSLLPANPLSAHLPDSSKFNFRDYCMYKISKVFAVGLAVTAVSGCFEVEDKNDDSVAAALQAQNDILQGQLTTTENPISLFGKVIMEEDPSLTVAATIKVKVGNEWRESIAVNGEFTIEELPVNSDIQILVESENDEFMSRMFYGKTVTVEQGQTAMQSVGDLEVSEGVVKTYSILDAETDESVEGIVFEYNPSSAFSNVSIISGLDDYIIRSSYDEQTQLYTITIPKDLNYAVTADRDIDGDGIVDFTPQNFSYYGSNSVILTASEALQLETMLVDITTAYMPVELRLSVIDRAGTYLPNIEFFASDQFLGPLDVTYDPGTEEYVFNYQSSGRVILNMPSFQTEDEVTYRSASVDIRSSTDTEMTVYTSGFANNPNRTVEVVDGIASMVVQAALESSNSSYISTISSIVDEEDEYSLKQFYSAPIGLAEDSVRLERRNVFKVIRGNESTTDIVAAGTTKLGNTTESVAITNSLSHGETFLTSRPDEDLVGGEYQYDVDVLINKQSGLEFDPRRSESFEIETPVEELPAFNINDIRLDNNNGTTNGTIIVAENTAGEASTTTNNSSTARLYFPLSIQTLDFFELNLVSYVRNGSSTISTRNIRVVDEDNIFVNERNLVTLATNETIESFTGYGTNADTNTSLEEGLWFYSSNSGFWAADNTGTSVNTATYRYIYRVEGEADSVEGTITLPVL